MSIRSATLVGAVAYELIGCVPKYGHGAFISIVTEKYMLPDLFLACVLQNLLCHIEQVAMYICQNKRQRGNSLGCCVYVCVWKPCNLQCKLVIFNVVVRFVAKHLLAMLAYKLFSETVSSLLVCLKKLKLSDFLQVLNALSTSHARVVTQRLSPIYGHVAFNDNTKTGCIVCLSELQGNS